MTRLPLSAADLRLINAALGVQIRRGRRDHDIKHARELRDRVKEALDGLS